MSGRDAEERADAARVRARLEAYYGRYYGGTLGIPGWRELVAVRLDDVAYERERLTRLELALGGSVAGARLLNVGCGTGGFNELAQRAGADTWGVDASSEAVTIAALRAPRRILCAAAEELPFPAASFDVVYCYSTLEHVADAGRAVREMVRVLRPGGLLYVHTPHRWACFEGHYKLFWLPGLPRCLATLYLALRGTEWTDSAAVPGARRACSAPRSTPSDAACAHRAGRQDGGPGPSRGRPGPRRRRARGSSSSRRRRSSPPGTEAPRRRRKGSAAARAGPRSSPLPTTRPRPTCLRPRAAPAR